MSTQSTDDPPTTECPLCGEDIDSRGIGSHKNSRPCKAVQGQNERDERGLRKVSTPTHKDIIRDLGGEIVTLATDFAEGSALQAGELRSYDYALEELVYEANNQYIPSPQDSPDAEYRIISETTEAYAVRVVAESMRASRYKYRDVDEGEIYIVEKTPRASDSSRLRKLYLHGDYVYRSGGYRVGYNVQTPIESDFEFDDDIAAETLSQII